MENRRRILIVDDEQGIRRLLTTAFTRAGYHVRSAACAAEALALCEAEAFDVLLSDVRMPGMNGHDLVRSVVQCRPEIRSVLMSGFDDLACEGCGVAGQPCTLLEKPFNPKDAVALVEQTLAQKTGEPASLGLRVC